MDANCPHCPEQKKKGVLRQFRASHPADAGVLKMPHVEQDLAAEALMLLGLKQGHGYDPDREQWKSWSRACLSMRLEDVPRA